MHCSIAYEAARVCATYVRSVAVNVYEVAVNEYEVAVTKLRWTMRSCGYEMKLHSLRECREVRQCTLHLFCLCEVKQSLREASQTFLCNVLCR